MQDLTPPLQHSVSGVRKRLRGLRETLLQMEAS
jgi:hypothetical protein